ncbi:MAG: glycine cleavage system aminomethyltransferase GcvT [Acidobacteriota bacterium]
MADAERPRDDPSESDAPRRTVLHAQHEAAGARFTDFAGWSMPVQYQGVLDEHRAVRTAAGLFDVSHMGEIRVEGADAPAFLQRMTPNNVAALSPGRAHYSALLTPEGTYIDDMLIYQLTAARYLLVVNASNRAAALAWLQQHAADDAVEIADESEQTVLLALQGPRAAVILAPLTDAALDDIAYYRFVHTRVDGAAQPVLVSRTGYTGEDGFELYLAPSDAVAVWEALRKAGADHGLVPAGLGARDTLRLEAGMALYGHEIDRDTTPYEARLGWTVKLKTGGAFVGRDALVRQREAGAARALVGFVVEGRGIARAGCDVRVIADDADAPGPVVGRVASGTFSPTREQAIGTAYVPTENADEGTRLAIDVRRRTLEARIVPMPFYRRAEPA